MNQICHDLLGFFVFLCTTHSSERSSVYVKLPLHGVFVTTVYRWLSFMSVDVHIVRSRTICVGVDLYSTAHSLSNKLCLHRSDITDICNHFRGCLCSLCSQTVTHAVGISTSHPGDVVDCLCLHSNSEQFL